MAIEIVKSMFGNQYYIRDNTDSVALYLSENGNWVDCAGSNVYYKSLEDAEAALMLKVWEAFKETFPLKETNCPRLILFGDGSGYIGDNNVVFARWSSIKLAIAEINRYKESQEIFRVFWTTVKPGDKLNCIKQNFIYIVVVVNDSKYLLNQENHTIYSAEKVFDFNVNWNVQCKKV
jgi:hypothetical protein